MVATYKAARFIEKVFASLEGYLAGTLLVVALDGGGVYGTLDLG
jgi:hypothetical protein